MARKSQTYVHPSHARPSQEATPHKAEESSPPSTSASHGLTALLEQATNQILAVTYWFDLPAHAHPTAVTVRFSGHRLHVKGQTRASDRFVQDETIEKVIPGNGPIALTARIRTITPGEWAVTAHIISPAASLQEKQGIISVSQAHVSGPLINFWRRWSPSAEAETLMQTCPTPLVHVPGLFPGIWGGMVGLGMIVALILQFVLIAVTHLVTGPWLLVSLGAIAVGIAGAKLWYILIKRREHLIDGWCIQGFVTGASLTDLLLLVLLRIPVGTFLDVTAPGLLLAMAIGRVGCFFAGCCGGPPTASRWGVWSSDQRIGAYRIPTQLLELGLALILGLATLLILLQHGPANGALFVGGLAAYTLVRQGILRLRAEQKTKIGELLTAVLSTLVLVAALVFLAR